MPPVQPLLAACTLTATVLHAEPPPWPDAVRLEAFLRQARVVGRVKIGAGITESVRLTLEQAEKRRDAIFKKVDSPHDSWRYEVAAYELDKLLGLGMVPPTVERRIKGRRGCLQLWVEGVTLRHLRDPVPAIDSWRQQVSRMWLFDDLAANTDRHLNNALVSPDYRLVLIDNSRSFRPLPTLLHDLNAAGNATRAQFWRVAYDSETTDFPVTLQPWLIERLRSLTRPQIKAALGRYIESYGRRLLLERRDALLTKLGEDPDRGTE